MYGNINIKTQKKKLCRMFCAGHKKVFFTFYYFIRAAKEKKIDFNIENLSEFRFK